jgi:hypothetical protein
MPVGCARSRRLASCGDESPAWLMQISRADRRFG